MEIIPVLILYGLSVVPVLRILPDCLYRGLWIVGIDGSKLLFGLPGKVIAAEAGAPIDVDGHGMDSGNTTVDIVLTRYPAFVNEVAKVYVATSVFQLAQLLEIGEMGGEARVVENFLNMAGRLGMVGVVGDIGVA